MLKFLIQEQKFDCVSTITDLAGRMFFTAFTSLYKGERLIRNNVSPKSCTYYTHKGYTQGLDINGLK